MTSYHIATYLVGGAVRDELLGIQSKDLDYTVTVDGASTVEEAWNAMRDNLEAEGFTIFLETPKYFTIRAKFPKGHVNAKQTADFVLAREEGPYLDGRRPSWARPGTLVQDLSRRDFTVNSLAKAEDGTIIDLFEGREDLRYRILRAVGDARERMLEDPLRVFRALRFSVTKNFVIHHELDHAMRNVGVLDAVSGVSSDRIRDELHRCFAFNTPATCIMLVQDYPDLLNIIADKGIWFMPTSKDTK